MGSATGTARRLVDRLGIGRIVLVALDVGMDVARRHEPDLMADGGNLAGPPVSAPTSLKANQARRELGKELEQLFLVRCRRRQLRASRVADGVSRRD